MSLAGKICVVTAAGQGIGRASAEAFHKAGGKVYARCSIEKYIRVAKVIIQVISMRNSSKPCQRESNRRFSM